MPVARLVMLVTLAACGARGPRPAIRNDVSTTLPPPTDPTAPWTQRFDFDGDHVPDVVDVAFSGGGHCCYTLAVHLTKTGRTVAVPFELDGGYVGGLSLDQPDNFNIEVAPDGVATMTMSIATYNGRGEAIPVEWQRTYAIHSHSIRVTLRDGTVRAEDRR
ncbi:MAG: hypothetical protein HOV81_05740 [Kofleriaceae bacterium]|nr:hypothetical protein [Kofleriaceae bacterium]